VNEQINNNENIISIENLNFYYAKQQTLFNICQNFKKNNITTIIGPSGSGKSTLLRVLNKIYAIYPYQKAEGKIIYRGMDIINDKINLVNLRMQIGMVFQKPTPFPMSIYENIAFALRTHYKLNKGELDEKVEEALQQAALWSEVKDKLHEAGTHLSGGQQQRLCFARTIAMKPKVLLLDEPTSSLDPVSSLKVQKLISNLRDKYTIIMVTHNLRQARSLGDQVIYMQQGRIIECNTADELFDNPQQQETKAYIATE
jgi:phosphate transport system ATP-binding protein